MASGIPQLSSRPPSRLLSTRAASPSISSQIPTRSTTPQPSTPTSTTFSPSISSPPPSTPLTKAQRRSSFEVLSSYTAGGPESFLPLPVPTANRRNSVTITRTDDSIKEGVPTEFNISVDSSSVGPKRGQSPTRTLSRIPVSSVGHARTLAEEGGDSNGTGLGLTNGDLLSASTSSSQAPGSPGVNNRKSLVGGTTKVLAELQAASTHARNALENTKAQLRLSQRTVAQLTRQTEDLKDGRERLRLENEGLNNVVARKERLLQEVLDRARKAEAEATALKAQLKAETASTKKSLKDMEVTMVEATASSQKSEREYLTLKDSVKGLIDGWKNEVKELREEMKKKDEAWKKESDDIGLKYRALVKLVQATKTERAKLDSMKQEAADADKQIEKHLRDELRKLQGEVDSSSSKVDEADRTAKELAAELERMRRLIKGVPRLNSEASE